MIGLLQRVSNARVDVAGKQIAAIEAGLLVFVGVQQGDREAEAQRLLDRLLGYRIFADSAGRMNHSVSDIRGGLLLVPQFTLAADTSKGMRPGFSSAASPADGQRMFDHLVRLAGARHSPVTHGCFGADMQVSLVNDGPVTFMLEVKPRQ